jgi:hypothetical protein
MVAAQSAWTPADAWTWTDVSQAPERDGGAAVYFYADLGWWRRVGRHGVSSMAGVRPNL